MAVPAPSKKKKVNSKISKRSNVDAEEVPVPDSPHGPADAAASSAPDPLENVSYGDIKQLCATTQQMQAQVGNIDDLSQRTGELPVNQSNSTAHIAEIEGRIDSLDPRVVELEDDAKAAKAEPVVQSAPSSAWDGLPSAAASPSFPPSPPTSAPRVFIHWDRPIDPTILRVNSNQNRISLSSVGDAFKEFAESFN